jgi:tRNA-specific 2-thiouridylase
LGWDHGPGRAPAQSYSGSVIELCGDSTRDGDWAVVRLRVDGQRVVHADAPGLDRDVSGMTLLDAAAVGGETLAVDALANAIGAHVAAGHEPSRVAVAMSGGVDSAVTLLHARAAGLDPVGVTLRLWIDPRGPDVESACCSPAAVIAARALCHELGVPHVTLDRREPFRDAIVAPFVSGYARGETPNPCVRCNGEFRFAELIAFADRVGAAVLATGHYARIVEREGSPALARAVDRDKDQSYMLATLPTEQLARVWFPLGEQTKDTTRAQAAAAGLDVAGRAESQEACFLGGGDYRTFLRRRGLAATTGAVLDESGRELGTHEGAWRFTPGQRRGLGISAAEPFYAIRTDTRTNTVIAGPRSSLARTRVCVRGHLAGDVHRVDVKLRYRSPAVPATVAATETGFDLELGEPAYGVAPGQAAVLYDADTVVGAGVILAAV